MAWQEPVARRIVRVRECSDAREARSAHVQQSRIWCHTHCGRVGALKMDFPPDAGIWFHTIRVLARTSVRQWLRRCMQQGWLLALVLLLVGVGWWAGEVGERFARERGGSGKGLVWSGMPCGIEKCPEAHPSQSVPWLRARGRSASWRRHGASWPPMGGGGLAALPGRCAECRAVCGAPPWCPWHKTGTGRWRRCCRAADLCVSRGSEPQWGPPGIQPLWGGRRT